MKYKVSLGVSSWIVTISLSVIFGILVAVLINFFPSIDQSLAGFLVALCTIALLLGIYIFCFLYRPLGYSIEPEKIVVNRLVKNVDIPLNNISDAYLVKKESMGWLTKNGGNAGLFGYFGEFTSSAFGSVKLYGTRTNHYLMIVTPFEKIVITPDDTEMIRKIREMIGK